MNGDEHKPIETPLPQRLIDFRHRTLPLLVWVVCALIVSAMLLGRANRFQYVGLAQSFEYEISPMTMGTLESVVVELYDSVEAGDMVAKLDDEPVLASIATANATIQRLRADFDAANTQLASDGGRGVANWTADLRRFQSDEEQRRLDMLALRVDIEGDEVERERLDLEALRAARLLEVGLISQTEYDITRLSRDQVRKRLEENRILLVENEQEYRSARSRREAFEANLPELPQDDPRLLPLKEAIEVQAQRLREIELARERLVLRSPISGQVSQILCRRGQSVVPGEPILLVAEAKVREIVAYLSEEDQRPIGPQTPVIVSSRNAGGAVSESVVLRVGPTVEALPDRLWQPPGVPSYGRAVVIAAAPSMQLLPGEQVNVRFLDPR